MHRFFVEKENILEDEGYITIDNAEDVKHISKVLRLKEEEIIEICDGNNREYISKISFIEKNMVKARILESKESATEPPIEVILFQGIPKSTKMELIIQKGTELGISKIVPTITTRTVVQLKDKKSEDKKVDRWQKIADEAAKQCKRGIIPTIAIPMTFNEILDSVSDYDVVIIPYEAELNNGIKAVLNDKKDVKKIAIIIGPEGGFAADEIEEAIKANVIPVSLGPRILRTETAGITALSIVMYELGDLGGN